MLTEPDGKGILGLKVISHRKWLVSCKTETFMGCPSEDSPNRSSSLLQPDAGLPYAMNTRFSPSRREPSVYGSIDRERGMHQELD